MKIRQTISQNDRTLVLDLNVFSEHMDVSLFILGHLDIFEILEDNQKLYFLLGWVLLGCLKETIVTIVHFCK